MFFISIVALTWTGYLTSSVSHFPTRTFFARHNGRDTRRHHRHCLVSSRFLRASRRKFPFRQEIMRKYVYLHDYLHIRHRKCNYFLTKEAFFATTCAARNVSRRWSPDFLDFYKIRVQRCNDRCCVTSLWNFSQCYVFAIRSCARLFQK